MTICIAVIVSQLSLIHLEFKQDSLPVDKILNGRCTIEVKSDSKKIGKGFRANVQINKLFLDNLEINCSFTGSCYSKEQLIQGDIYKNVEIKNRSLYIKDYSLFVENSFLTRKTFISNIKHRVCSALLLGLLIGDKSSMESHIIELFRKTGTSHILALSGFHLGLLTFIVLIILKPFLTGNKRYILANCIILFYLILTGITPSLFRAFIMLQILTIYKINNIEISIIDILCLSFFISLLIRPNDFYTISFKLSYLALFGVIIISNSLMKHRLFSIMPSIISNPVTASIGAILLTSPTVLKTFGELYPIGIIASLILTPIIVVYIWIGIVSIFMKPLEVIIFILDDFIIKIASFLSKCPYLIINEENSLFISLIFISLPVILYFTTLLRRRDVRRFNSKFKL